MNCPFCFHKKTEVYNSRSTAKLHSIWRRRRCLACHQVFTTRETIDLHGIMKVQSSTKKTSPYLPWRLQLSLLQACDHRTDLEKTLAYIQDLIEQQLLLLASKKQGNIKTTDIVSACGEVLKHFDPAAYIKYLSYHAPAVDMRGLKRQLRS